MGSVPNCPWRSEGTFSFFVLKMAWPRATAARAALLLLLFERLAQASNTDMVFGLFGMTGVQLRGESRPRFGVFDEVRTPKVSNRHGCAGSEASASRFKTP